MTLVEHSVMENLTRYKLNDMVSPVIKFASAGSNSKFAITVRTTSTDATTSLYSG